VRLRRNGDRDLRALERAQAAGDPQAGYALHAERLRAGLPLVPDETLDHVPMWPTAFVRFDRYYFTPEVGVQVAWRGPGVLQGGPWHDPNSGTESVTFAEIEHDRRRGWNETRFQWTKPVSEVQVGLVDAYTNLTSPEPYRGNPPAQDDQGPSAARQNPGPDAGRRKLERAALAGGGQADWLHVAREAQRAGDVPGYYVALWHSGVREDPTPVYGPRIDGVRRTTSPLVGQDAGLWLYLPRHTSVWAHERDLVAEEPNWQVLSEENPLIGLLRARWLAPDPGWPGIDAVVPRKVKLAREKKIKALQASGYKGDPFEADLLLTLRAHDALGWPLSDKTWCPFVRRNPGMDADLRKLERLAQQGDRDAVLALHTVRRRAGVPETGEQALEYLLASGAAVRVFSNEFGNTQQLLARIGCGYLGDGAASPDRMWWSRGHPDAERQLPGAWAYHYRDWVVVLDEDASPEIRARLARLPSPARALADMVASLPGRLPSAARALERARSLARPIRLRLAADRSAASRARAEMTPAEEAEFAAEWRRYVEGT